MRIEVHPETWDRWKSEFPSADDLNLSAEEIAMSKLLGVRVTIDPSLPDGEMRFVSGSQVLRVINLGVDD